MKDKIKKIILSLGADVCGIANIQRFTNTPKGFSPSDSVVNCKSVIAFGLSLPRGLLTVAPRLIYGHFNYESCSMVDGISFRAAKALEKEYDCYAVPIPCDSPYEDWDEESLHGKGLLSMKHAAVLAGLGTLGKNTLLLNPQYGNLLTLGAILTDLDLPSDDLCDSICIENCTKCMDNCPVGAIQNGVVTQKTCRNNTYNQTKRGFDTVDCNRCRTVCPAKYGVVSR